MYHTVKKYIIVNTITPPSKRLRFLSEYMSVNVIADDSPRTLNISFRLNFMKTRGVYVSLCRLSLYKGVQ